MYSLMVQYIDGTGSPGQRFWPGRVTGQNVRPGV